MKTYSLVVRQLSESIHYIQNQLRLRVPGHSDVVLCRECVTEPKTGNSSHSSFWSGLNKVFADLANHHGYRM